MKEKAASIWKRPILLGISPFRFVRRLFSWQMLRRYLFVLACLATLVALFYAEEDWRGKRAWMKFKTEWEAKGEKFDLRDFVPPPVPDDQNFAMTPFLAPLLDFNREPLQPGQSRWRDTNGYQRIENFAIELNSSDAKVVGRRWHDRQRADFDIWWEALQTNSPATNAYFATRAEAATELLKDFGKYQPVLAELQSASQRPYCRFNLGYADELPAGILLPHLAVMKRLAQMFALRASAELILGRNELAFADTKMVFYLAGTMKDEPFLISGLVRIAILQSDLRLIQSGIAAHEWTDSELSEFETLLGRDDLLAEYGRQMRGERACANGTTDYLRTRRRINEVAGDDGGSQSGHRSFGFADHMPGGWFYQNQLVINRMHQEFLLPPVDAVNHRVDPAKCLSNQSELERELNHGFPPYKMFARLLLPALDKIQIKYAFAQANLDLARLACALERYRLANGQYPDNLAALSPKFITAVPNDVISGEPLKYHRTDDGQFVLYSVGWNQTDDGGSVVMLKGGKSPDITKGDWVWPPYPAK